MADSSQYWRPYKRLRDKVLGFLFSTITLLGHLMLATYGIEVLSILLVLPLALTIPGRFTSYLVMGPTFAFPAILGLLMGYKFGRQLPSAASRLLWVPSFLLLAYELYFSWYRLQWPGENLRVALWNNYIGTDCSESECLYEFLETIPLVAALTYTVGAEFGRLKAKMKPQFAVSTKLQ